MSIQIVHSITFDSMHARSAIVKFT